MADSMAGQAHGAGDASRDNAREIVVFKKGVTTKPEYDFTPKVASPDPKDRSSVTESVAESKSKLTPANVSLVKPDKPASAAKENSGQTAQQQQPSTSQTSNGKGEQPAAT